MAKIKLTHSIRMSMIGKCSPPPRGSSAVGDSLFCKVDLLIDCGLTTKKEFSLGQDGTSQITITNYKFHDTKQSILAAIQDSGKVLNNFIDEWAWRNYCKDQGHIFTGAFINAIFKKTASNKVWLYSDWWLRCNKEQTMINVNALKKPVHFVDPPGSFRDPKQITRPSWAHRDPFVQKVII